MQPLWNTKTQQHGGAVAHRVALHGQRFKDGCDQYAVTQGHCLKPCECLCSKMWVGKSPVKVRKQLAVDYLLNWKAKQMEKLMLTKIQRRLRRDDVSACVRTGKEEKAASPSRPREPWGQQSWLDACRSMWCASCWCLATGSPASTSNQSWFACCSSRMSSWGWSSPRIAVRGQRQHKWASRIKTLPPCEEQRGLKLSHMLAFCFHSKHPKKKKEKEKKRLISPRCNPHPLWNEQQVLFAVIKHQAAPCLSSIVFFWPLSLTFTAWQWTAPLLNGHHCCLCRAPVLMAGTPPRYPARRFRKVTHNAEVD